MANVPNTRVRAYFWPILFHGWTHQPSIHQTTCPANIRAFVHISHPEWKWILLRKLISFPHFVPEKVNETKQNTNERERKKKQFTQIKISFVLSWINSSNTALVNLNAAFSTSPPPNRKSTEQSGQRKSVREKRKEEYAYKQKVMWFPLSGSIFIHFAQRNHKCNNFACLLHRMKMP